MKSREAFEKWWENATGYGWDTPKNIWQSAWDARGKRDKKKIKKRLKNAIKAFRESGAHPYDEGLIDMAKACIAAVEDSKQRNEDYKPGFNDTQG